MSSELNWHKSSYSGGEGGACIEVADNAAWAVLVRDTKDHSKGTLNVSPEAWSEFVESAASKA